MRFQREMRAVGALDHPGIIRATDAGEVDGTHFLVTELVDGVDLSQLIEQLGPLPVGAACEAICQVADALQHVHEHGLVHRDIKPTNLMVDSAGQVKILDLGLALLGTPHGADATATGSVERSAAFMSPERLFDTRSGDIRSDIYSLGCTLFYLLAGTPPFDGDDYRTITPKLAADAQFVPTALNNCRSDVPPRVEEAIERMMAKDPASRFRSPAEVVEHLREFAEGGLGSLSARASQQPVCLAINDQKTCPPPFSPPVPTTADPLAPVATAGLLGGLRSKRRLRPVLFWVAVVLAIAGGLAAAIQLSNSWRPSAGTNIQAPAISAAAPTRNASVAVVQPTERDSPAPQTDTFIGHTQHVLDLDLSHDGQWLLSGAADATVRLWDVATAQQIHEMRGHTNYVATVCFVSDGQEAISGGNDHTLRRWDLATGEQLMTYKGHASVVTSLTVSHDGQSFLSGSFDALINMWDRDQPLPEAVFGYRDASDSLRVTQLSDLNSLDGHISWVRSVAFAGDSTKFISAGNEALLAIWDVATGTIAHRLVGHTQPITRALFLPGDQRVVSASLDSTIRLWNADNGQLLQTFSGLSCSGRVPCRLARWPAVSRDGRGQVPFRVSFVGRPTLTLRRGAFSCWGGPLGTERRQPVLCRRRPQRAQVARARGRRQLGTAPVGCESTSKSFCTSRLTRGRRLVQFPMLPSP